MKTIFVLFAIIVSMTMIPAFAQIESKSLVIVDTSESSYEEGDTIVVTGSVRSIILDTPITLQIFREGNLVNIAQLTVAQDGTFTHTILAQGPLWQSEGDIVVRASYGEGNTAETNFNFYTKKEQPETTNIFEVDAGDSGTFDVEYTIRGGIVKDMIIDPENFALIVIIESEDNGIVSLDLPRSSLDATKSDGTDDTFIILIDGIEVPYQESTTDIKSRIITIDFEQGDSDIEIIGTFVIPEFGAIAALILAVAIISIIVISKNKILVKI